MDFHLSLLLDVLRFFRFFLSDVPQHHFFVSFGKIVQVTLRTVIAESLILSIVTLLIHFHFFELLLMVFEVLLELARLLLAEPFVVFFNLNAMVLELPLLFCQGDGVAPFLIH